MSQEGEVLHNLFLYPLSLGVCLCECFLNDGIMTATWK